MLRFALAACLSLALAGQSPGPAVVVTPQQPAVAAGQLVYDLVVDAPGLAGAVAGSDALREETVARLRERLPAGAKLEWQGGAGFTVTSAAVDAAAIAALRYRVETVGRVDLRLVAAGDYFASGFHYDLRTERERLREWLDAGHGDEVRRDPRAIAAFHSAPGAGPLAGAKLHWCAHRIGMDPVQTGRWEARLGDLPSLRESVVLVDPEEDWNNGSIPPHVQKRPAAARHLLELVAVNCDERHFGGDAIDPAGFRLLGAGAPAPAGGVAPLPAAGGAGIGFKVRGQFAAEFADWTEQWIGHHLAVLLDEQVLYAPRFEGRVPGEGAMTGAFAPVALEDLLAVLRAPLPGPAPRLVKQSPASK